MAKLGVPVVLATHWGDGGKGAAELARDRWSELCETVRRSFKLRLRGRRAAVGQDQQDREEDLPRRRGHRRRQGAQPDQEAAGGRLRPLPGVRGEDAVFVLHRRRSCAARRADHVVNMREVRLAAGAEFVVMICGDIMTMPGLPKVPVGGEDRPGRRQSRRAVLESPAYPEGCMEEVLTQAFWIGLLKIIGVNIVLSGDNAVVIALAARSLPPRQQKQAIFWGAGAAVVMRIVLTIFAVALLDAALAEDRRQPAAVLDRRQAAGARGGRGRHRRERSTCWPRSRPS